VVVTVVVMVDLRVGRVLLLVLMLLLQVGLNQGHLKLLKTGHVSGGWTVTAYLDLRHEALEESGRRSVHARQNLVRLFHQQSHLTTDGRVSRSSFVLNSCE
jgi:hypothetical protein